MFGPDLKRVLRCCEVKQKFNIIPTSIERYMAYGIYIIQDMPYFYYPMLIIVYYWNGIIYCVFCGQNSNKHVWVIIKSKDLTYDTALPLFFQIGDP